MIITVRGDILDDLGLGWLTVAPQNTPDNYNRKLLTETYYPREGQNSGFVRKHCAKNRLFPILIDILYFNFKSIYGTVECYFS